VKSLTGSGDLGGGLFHEFRGQRLAAAMSDFEQPLKGAKIISGRGQPLGELMT
jgi:hypothetical protein